MTTESSQTRTLGFVAFICFIDMCGIGLIIPVLPSLLRDLTGAGLGDASAIGSWLFFVYAGMQFSFAPVIGGLSDRFGRRPVLLTTLAMLGLDYGVMALAPTLAWLFVGRAISGVMGATWSAANSCIADVCTPETRGKAFGLLGAGGAAGFVFGPAIGGLLEQFGNRAPFFAASALALTGALIGFRLLPETLPKDRQRAFDWKRANPIGSLMQMAKVRVVLGFIAVIFMMQMGGQVTNAVWSFYNILKFNWSPLMVGISAAVFGVMVALAQGGLTAIAIPRFGEAKVGLFGLCFAIPAYLVFAFAASTWHMFAGILIGAIGNVSFPAMQALMTRAIPEDAQGELQGAIASTISLTSIIGPVMMAYVFKHFSDNQGLYFPGAPFLLAAGFMAMAVGLFALTVRRT